MNKFELALVILGVAAVVMTLVVLLILIPNLNSVQDCPNSSYTQSIYYTNGSIETLSCYHNSWSVSWITSNAGNHT